MKVRIRFAKSGDMRFIGHLDMMRYFQKAFRRCGLDVAYSEGFSPHQQISFASPLGVGLTSTGEYMDVFMNSSLSSEASMRMINEQMVPGVVITGYKRIADETRASNAMSIIRGADYLVWFRTGYAPSVPLSDWVTAFMALPRALVTKQTKKNTREVDIRPLVKEMRVVSRDTDPSLFEMLSEMDAMPEAAGEEAIFMRVCAGSLDNLKPETVVGSMVSEGVSAGLLNPEDVSGITDPDPYVLYIHRLEMYAEDASGTWVSLDALGGEIR